jgi:MFS family permease
LLASRFIQGAGGGTTGVLHAYVADTVPADDRARSLGWLSAATSAGVMIGPVIGSTAAYWGQLAPGMVAAGLCLMNIVFAWGWLQESSGANVESRTKKRKPVWHRAWTVARYPTRAISRLVWIYALGMLAFSSFTSIITLYLGFEFAITERNVGYVFMYMGGLSVVMRSLLLGPIVDRLGEIWTMRLGASSLLIGFLSFPFAVELWILLALMSFLSVGTALTFPSTTALTSRWTEPSELGTTMGTAQAFAGMSRTVSPLVSTMLFQQLGHTFPFFAAAACSGVVVLLSLQVRNVAPGKAGVEDAKAVPLFKEGPSEGT